MQDTSIYLLHHIQKADSLRSCNVLIINYKLGHLHTSSYRAWLSLVFVFVSGMYKPSYFHSWHNFCYINPSWISFKVVPFMGNLWGSNKSNSLNFCSKLFLENKAFKYRVCWQAVQSKHPGFQAVYWKFLQTSTDHPETVQQFVTGSHIFPSHVVLNMMQSQPNPLVNM